MAARGRGDKTKTHLPFGIGETYRTAKPDMTKGAWAHCVGSRWIELLLQHAA